VGNSNGTRAACADLALTQAELAEEMGVRQQTISEWETGAYAPRGASERLLTIIADRAGFAWGFENEPGEMGRGKGPDAGHKRDAGEDA
jgi:transcriptional regulator with XRE-family HTH domain